MIVMEVKLAIMAQIVARLKPRKELGFLYSFLVKLLVFLSSLFGKVSSLLASTTKPTILARFKLFKLRRRLMSEHQACVFDYGVECSSDLAPSLSLRVAFPR